MQFLKRFVCNKITLGVKSFSVHHNVQEVRIPVPWGHVAGKWWGPRHLRPILTLHGWQANCGSFDRLLPLLKPQHVSFLAVDFSGHGYSSRIPIGMSYNLMEMIILIQYIVNYFQWSKVSMLGHSVGGMVAYTYALYNPRNVDFLMCIDGIKSVISPDIKASSTRNFKKFINLEELSRSTKEPSSYTMEEIKSIVHASYSINEEFCHHVFERNIAPSKLFPGKYYFTTDPRLKAAGVFNISQKELFEYTTSLKSPIFVANFKKGIYCEDKDNFNDFLDVFKNNNHDNEFIWTKGGHYAHLTNPETLSHALNNFIEKHIDDRPVSGKQYDNLTYNFIN